MLHRQYSHLCRGAKRPRRERICRVVCLLVYALAILELRILACRLSLSRLIVVTFHRSKRSSSLLFSHPRSTLINIIQHRHSAPSTPLLPPRTLSTPPVVSVFQQHLPPPHPARAFIFPRSSPFSCSSITLNTVAQSDQTANPFSIPRSLCAWLITLSYQQADHATLSTLHAQRGSVLTLNRARARAGSLTHVYRFPPPTTPPPAQ